MKITQHFCTIQQIHSCTHQFEQRNEVNQFHSLILMVFYVATICTVPQLWSSEKRFDVARIKQKLLQ